MDPILGLFLTVVTFLMRLKTGVMTGLRLAKQASLLQRFFFFYVFAIFLCLEIIFAQNHLVGPVQLNSDMV